MDEEIISVGWLCSLKSLKPHLDPNLRFMHRSISFLSSTSYSKDSLPIATNVCWPLINFK